MSTNKSSNINNESEEQTRRMELERLEINAAYDNGFSNDFNESFKGGSSAATLKLNEKSKNSSNKKTINGTIKSISSVFSHYYTGTNPALANSGLLSNEFSDRIDRYGFIHDSKLPSTLTETELKRNQIEKLREKKWISMLRDWTAYNGKYYEKLSSRVFKGIPDSMRNSAWYKLLEIESQIKAQTGVYEKMKNLARQYSLELRQIDLDINRTFRNNLAYKKRYCQRQVQLYNILSAYSIYNTEIGYCQGMSTVTALLLMYLSDEEKTFWALSQLMSNPKYSMHGFFKRDFPKLIRYTDKHDMIIKTLLPKVHKKFIKCNITSLLYTTKWFLQCYLDALPFSLVLRVWDVYLLKGDIAMLAMSYCILRIHKKRLLLKEYDMDKINEFLNHKLPEDFLLSDDEVMMKLELCIEKLSRFKFNNGQYLLEPIPQLELPKIPFGDFKKIDKQEIITQITQKSNEKAESQDRDTVVEKMAKDRLEEEKKKREERRQKRRQELNNLNIDPNNNSFGGEIFNEGDKPIPNISDDDYDDDEDDQNDEDDDDDDLNPSKLSEYDEDEKADKESLLSNLTHGSSTQQSNNDIHSQTSIELNKNNSNCSSLRKLSSKTGKLSLVNVANPFDSSNPNNSTPPLPPSLDTRTLSPRTYKKTSTALANSSGTAFSEQNLSNISSSSISNQQSKLLQHIAKSNLITTNEVNNRTALSASDLITYSKTGDSVSSLNSISNNKNLYLNSNQTSISSASTNNTNNNLTMPNSKSYMATASIISNPPPLSPSAFLASPTQQSKTNSKYVTSIKTNPSYYATNSSNKNFEYVRSPHGIYTRINVPPTMTNKSTAILNYVNRPNGNNSPSGYQITQQSKSYLFNTSDHSTNDKNTGSNSNYYYSNQSATLVNQALLSSSLSSAAAAAAAAAANATFSPMGSSKRTASLRNIKNEKESNKSTEKQQSNGNLISNNNTNFNRINTPTQQQLQNHSLRIANITEHQHHNYYPTVSIVSQMPKQVNESYQQHAAINCELINSINNGLANNKQHKINKLNEDLIEQYDYI